MEEEYYDEYEIDLTEYLYLLYKNKFLIIGITIFSIFIALFASYFILAETYKSEITFLANNFRLINNQSITKSEYITFFQRDNIKEELLNKYYPEKENISFLDKKFNLETEEESQIVNISYTGSEPEKTANVLNDWYNKFESEVYSYLETNNNDYLDSLEAKKDNDYQKYISNLNEYNNFKKENNINLLKMRLNKHESRLVSLENSIRKINNNIESKNTELKTVNTQLSNTKEFLTKKESITDESLNKLQSINPNQELINLLTTENEFYNPQYSNLKRSKNNVIQDISVLKTDLKNNKGEIKELENKILSLEKEINNLEEKEEILKDELNNSKSNYNSSINKYDNVRQSLIEKDYNIELISKANINENPISPNKKLNIAIAGVLGLMLSIFIVFFKEFIKNADLEKYKENN